jgi:hypothetical protein
VISVSPASPESSFKVESHVVAGIGASAEWALDVYFTTLYIGTSIDKPHSVLCQKFTPIQMLHLKAKSGRKQINTPNAKPTYFATLLVDAKAKRQTP